jgi:N-acetylmuramoyl-L-alanine amidase
MTEKRNIRAVYLVGLLCFFMNFAWAQKVNTVVLDAGHGGHDTGALGKNSREKDIALSIVLKLRDYIQANMKDVKVILTRDSDYFVELYQRAKIANENKADLFISIHCNSTQSALAYGVETFVMGLHKSNANLAVAKAENAAILLEDNYVEKYDGFDPNSPEGNIFFNMMQNAFLDRSLVFAGNVQHQLVDNLQMYDRGVKQAGFLVLYKTAMPGVLIETGFISNPKDEKFLLSEKGQDQTALAIYKAFREYRNSVEKRNAGNVLPDSLLIPERKPMTNTQVTPPAAKNSQTVNSATNTVELRYRVQFAVFPDPKPVTDPLFKDVKDVKRYTHKGMYKYTSGDFLTLDEANKYRNLMIARGFKDAFVVAFMGNERITNEEARQLSSKK